MIELVKQSAVPANVMRTAAKGALALPAAEMLEILVYLAGTALFGQEARMTLAGWDVQSCLAVCSDPSAPAEVLAYFVSLENRRPALVPALLENPAVAEDALLQMAQEQHRETIECLLGSPRVNSTANLLSALLTNPALTAEETARVQNALQALPAPAERGGEDLDSHVAQFVAEHAAEIAAEEGKAFQLVEEPDDERRTQPEAAPAPAAPTTRPHTATAAVAAQERLSPLQKISRLSVGERVQLAMKGNKEERYILVRDGAKVVSAAVLESPKLTEQEVETFAGMKNVQETVLRGIAGKRKFMKIYAVIRALANNPRCPLDVQLTLIKNLLNNDLRALSANKNVSDVARKLALKLYRERNEKRTGGQH